MNSRTELYYQSLMGGKIECKSAVVVLDMSPSTQRLCGDELIADVLIRMLTKLLKELKGCRVTLVVYSDGLITVAQNVEASESLAEFVKDTTREQKYEPVHLLEYCVFAFNFLPDGARSVFLLTDGVLDIPLDCNVVQDLREKLIKVNILRPHSKEDDFGFIGTDFRFLQQAIDAEVLEDFAPECMFQEFQLTKRAEGVNVHFKDYFIQVPLELLFKSRISEGFKLTAFSMTKRTSIALQYQILPFVAVEYKIRAITDVRVDIHLITTQEFANAFISYKYTGGDAYGRKVVDFLKRITEADELLQQLPEFIQTKQIDTIVELPVVRSWFFHRSWNYIGHEPIEQLLKSCIPELEEVRRSLFCSTDTGDFLVAKIHKQSPYWNQVLVFSNSSELLDRLNGFENENLLEFPLEQFDKHPYFSRLEKEFSINETSSDLLFCLLEKLFKDSHKLDECVFLKRSGENTLMIKYALNNTLKVQLFWDFGFRMEIDQLLESIQNMSRRIETFYRLLAGEVHVDASCLYGFPGDIFEYARSYNFENAEVIFKNTKECLSQIEVSNSSSLAWIFLMNDEMSAAGWKILSSSGVFYILRLSDSSFYLSQVVASENGLAIKFFECSTTLLLTDSAKPKDLRRHFDEIAKRVETRLLYSMLNKAAPCDINIDCESLEKSYIELDVTKLIRLQHFKQLIFGVIHKFFSAVGRDSDLLYYNQKKTDWKSLLGSNPIFLRTKLISANQEFGFEDSIISEDPVTLRLELLQLPAQIREALIILYDNSSPFLQEVSTQLEQELDFNIQKQIHLQLLDQPIDLQMLKAIDGFIQNQKNTLYSPDDLPIVTYLTLIKPEVIAIVPLELGKISKVTNVGQFYILDSAEVLKYQTKLNYGLGISAADETEMQPPTDIKRSCLYVKFERNNAIVSLLSDATTAFKNKLRGNFMSIIEAAVKRSNQRYLLNQLNVTRICSQLLLPSEEEEELNEEVTEAQFKSGEFQCPLIQRWSFPLHWRFKQNQALNYLSGVLHPFSLNRRQVFVYQQKDAVFYFTLVEADGNLVLEMFGLDTLDSTIDEFTQMIEIKLHSLTLNIISTSLVRNITLKLSPQDLSFIFQVKNGCSKRLSLIFEIKSAVILAFIKQTIGLAPFGSPEIVSGLKSHLLCASEDTKGDTEVPLGEYCFLYNALTRPSNDIYFGQGLALINFSAVKDGNVVSLYPLLSTEDTQFQVRCDVWIQGYLNAEELKKHIEETYAKATRDAQIEETIVDLRDMKAIPEDHAVDNMFLSAPIERLIELLSNDSKPLYEFETVRNWNRTELIEATRSSLDEVNKFLKDANLLQLKGSWGPYFQDDADALVETLSHTYMFLCGLREPLTPLTPLLPGLFRRSSSSSFPADSPTPSFDTMNELSLLQNTFLQTQLDQKTIVERHSFVMVFLKESDKFTADLLAYNVRPGVLLSIQDRLKGTYKLLDSKWSCFDQFLWCQFGYPPLKQCDVSSVATVDFSKMLADISGGAFVPYELDVEVEDLKSQELMDSHLTPVLDLYPSYLSKHVVLSDEEDWPSFLRQARVLHWCRTPLLFSPLRDSLFRLSGDSYYLTSLQSAQSEQGGTMKRRLTHRSSIKHALEAFPEDSAVLEWFQVMTRQFMEDYVAYLQSLGMCVVYSDHPSIPSSVDLKLDWESKFVITKDLKVDTPLILMEKVFQGGVLLIDIRFTSMFVSVNVYTAKSHPSALHAEVEPLGPTWSHSNNLNRQLFRIFTEESHKFKNLIHLNSFVYDFHLRYIFETLKNCPCSWLNWVDIIHAFIKYNITTANYAKNRIFQDKFVIERSMTRDDMFKYLGSHPKQYGVELLYFDGVVNGCYLELENEDVSLLLVLFATEDLLLEDGDKRKWTIPFCLLAINSDKHPLLTRESLVSKISVQTRQERTIEKWQREVIKQCHEIIDQLVDQSFLFYARDSLWRRLVDSLQNAKTEFTLADFLVLATRYYTRPIVDLEPSLRELLECGMDWEDLLMFLSKLYPMSKQFRERRVPTDESIHHLIILNPESVDLLVHLAVVDGKSMIFDAVSREKDVKQRQDSVIELAFVSDLIQSVCFYLYKKAVH